MEDTFTTAIGRWRDFESLVGAAAATLLGLLFVAASLRPTAFNSNNNPDHPDLLSIGLDTMIMFLLTIAIALLLLIPDINSMGLGVSFIVLAIFSLIHKLRDVIATHQVIRHEWGIWFFTRRVILPGIGYVLLMVIGVNVVTGQVLGLSGLGGLQLLFLFTGTYNAWSLLTRVDKGQHCQ